MSTHRVVFLLFDGVTSLDVSGPAEVFAEANRAGARYALQFTSPTGNAVRTSIGVRLEVEAAAADITRADTVIIAGGDRLPVSPIEPELLEATRHLGELGGRVASICTGAFLLAATGVLTGRRATTHWENAALLARAYPQIHVEPDALFVSDGRFHTSAGVSSGIDLALALLQGDHSAAMARQVARRLVVHLQRSGGQSQFSAALSTPEPRTPPVRRMLQAVMADPAQPHTLTSLARISGVSPRHLTRLVASELSTTPARLVENHRLEAAINLLLGGSSVAQTASASGFTTAETLRRVFVARLGVPPSVYRQRFASSHPGPGQTEQVG